MLKNATLDAKIGFDPAENEPPKECCVVADPGVEADAVRAAAVGGERSRPTADRALSALAPRFLRPGRVCLPVHFPDSSAPGVRACS